MTRSVEIPEEAVAAAARVFFGGAYGAVGDEGNRVLHDGARKALEAALPYLAPAGPEDMRTEEEKGFVEIALAAADSGSAGHWPTVAGYLADEVRRLRATLPYLAPAGDGGLREAVDDLRAWVAMQQETAGFEESEYSAGEFLAYKRTIGHLNKILAAHPAAPAVPQPAGDEDAWNQYAAREYGEGPLAVPQPVDREALRERITEAIFEVWLVHSELKTVAAPVQHCEAFADAVLAVLAGEQEQVET